MITPEQADKIGEKIIELFPEYSQSEDMVEEAMVSVLGIEMAGWDRNDSVEAKRYVYRRLKQRFDVKIQDDHLTREDLDLLDEAHDLLSDAIIELQAIGGNDEEIAENIDKAREKIREATSK